MLKKLLTVAATTLAMLSPSMSVGAITNGVIDTENDFVGAMTGVDPGGTERLCSGALIAPGVFLTAGHCAVLVDVEIHFGDDLEVAETVYAATSVNQHPQYAGNFGNQFDVGVVTFDQGTDVLHMASLAEANYIDGFSNAELKTLTFDTYGYGLWRDDTNGNSAPLMDPDGKRRSATSSYLNRHNQYLGLSIHNNKGNGGACFGDSGGPHMVHNVIVSVTSNGDGNCVATDNTQRIDQPVIRDWILSFTS